MDHRPRLPLEIASAIYRLGEAALENAVRHSGASQIDVFLSGSLRAARFEVRDNGCGFNPEDPPRRGLGLPLMRHHAARVRGVLKFDSKKQDGTTISFQVRDWE
jgi:signal transduction histidine kinase